MVPETRYRRHERLVSRMAERAGVDLDLAEFCGALRPGERHEAVLACTGCISPADCEATPGAGRGDVPAYCRNAAFFDELTTLLPARD